MLRTYSNYIIITLLVPGNTTATLYLNAPSVNVIVENGKLLKTVNAVKYLGQRNKKFVFELSSGEYNIEVRWPLL